MSPKEFSLLLAEGQLQGYSQVFFSKKKSLAILLLLTSFIDVYTGLAGFLAVFFCNLLAIAFGYSSEEVKGGSYGFNALLMGLALGVYFKFTLAFLLVLFLASLLTLFLTVLLNTLCARHGVPALSLPFVLAVWVMLLSLRSYSEVGLSERGIYIINEMYGLGGQAFIDAWDLANALPLPEPIAIYLKSLGAIFFEYNLPAGIIIATGLLIWSRIAFSLSLVGYFSGYLFYLLLGGNFAELSYSYVGFNFILSAIAIGGFFLVPSTASYLFVFIVTPLIALLNSAVTSFTSPYQLPVYSLAFNITVIALLYVLKMRLWPRHLHLTPVQHFSPEENLYRYHNSTERFRGSTLSVIQLPFYGEWSVSQAHEGAHTHKDDWKHAWDFAINDDDGRSFRLPGTSPEHYYCYNRPVLASAAGYVANVSDHIPENAIGNVNMEKNWGNSVVIKHAEGLYSQCSHLVPGTIKVKLNDYVQQGDIIGYCGNSGRSPEPHIHFQLQATPHIGSRTLKYPLSYYMRNNKGSLTFHSFNVPQKEDIISNVAVNHLLKEAFHFIPGKTMLFETEENGHRSLVKWEVMTNGYNQTYLYCHGTQSVAYLINNGVLHYFTNFEGNRNSLLWHFYQAAFKVLLGFYKGLEISDLLPVTTLGNNGIRLLHDFIAPFGMLMQARYSLVYKSIDEGVDEQSIVLESAVNNGRIASYRMELKNRQLATFSVNSNRQTLKARCIG